MTSRGTRPRLRTLVAVLAVTVLIVGIVVAFGRGGDRSGDRVAPPPPTADPSAPTSPATASPTPELDDELASQILTDVERAAGTSPESWRAAAAHLLAGAWSQHVDTAWRQRVAVWQTAAPMVVGDVTVAADARTVSADLVFLLRPSGDRVVFRTLAAATVLGDTAFEFDVAVDGVAVEPEVDRDGARTTVVLPDPETGGADRLVRVRASYVVPTAGQIIDDGGPAGGGLLARSDGVTTLGHWLPVPTFDTGPMVARGDVGAFDAALWSVRIRHPGVLVTGAAESPCPDRDACTQTVGVALRDLSAVLFDTERDVDTAEVGDLEVRGFAPPGRAAGDVTDEAARSAEILAGHFGTLPWTQVDVVGVPLGHAGMEFPGMAWLQSSRWTSDRGFASYVNAHEVGHQWFHALVGNGSLSAPFLDESLAQYAAYLVFADLFGQQQADGLAAEQFEGRFNRAGRPADPVCLPLDGFASANSYGAVVYGRGGAVWVDLERQHGREAVVQVLRRWIDRVGLTSGIMPDDLVAAAAVGAPEVEADLAEDLLDERC